MNEGMIFGQSDLDALVRPAYQRVEAAVASGDAARVGETCEAIERAFRVNARSFSTWATMTGEFLDEMEIRGAPHRDVAAAWRVGAFGGVQAADVDCVERSHAAELEELFATSGADVALARYREIEDSFRRIHDARVDWVSWLWSLVYRTGGPDALERCLRRLADRTLLRWMEHDIVASPAERLQTWSNAMMSNFAACRLEELPDRFRFVQDPCGTCTRQLNAGAYEPPLDLAIVADEHPLTYGDGGLPVYRTHVAVMHWMMPPERIGTAWPIVRCPARAGTGACTIDLMKNPLVAAPDEDVAVRLRATTTEMKGDN